MKKKIVGILLIMAMLVSLICMLTGCKKENDLDPNKEYVNINIPKNGSTYNQIGYMILDENIIKLKKVDYEDTKKYKDSVGYTTNNDYYFEGVKEGKTEIWVVDMYPEETSYITKYEISVDSNLNAKITNSPERKYASAKCGSLNIKNVEVNFENAGIAKDLYISSWPETLKIIGVKPGNTTMTLKEKNGTEKKYDVKVDANLNVELTQK